MRRLAVHWIRSTLAGVGLLLVAGSVLLAHSTTVRTLRSQLLDSNTALTREVATHIEERVLAIDRRLIELAGRDQTRAVIHHRFDNEFLRLSALRATQTNLQLFRRSDPLIQLAGVHSAAGTYLLVDTIGLTYAGSTHRTVDTPSVRSIVEPIAFSADRYSTPLVVGDAESAIVVIPIVRLHPPGTPAADAIGSVFAAIDVSRLEQIVLHASYGRVHDVVVLSSPASDKRVIAASSPFAANELPSLAEAEGLLQPAVGVGTAIRRDSSGALLGISRYVIEETGWVFLGAVPLGGGAQMLRPVHLTFLIIGAGMAILALLSFTFVAHFTVDPLIGFVGRLSTDLLLDQPRRGLPGSTGHLVDLEHAFRDAVDQSERLRDRFASTRPIVQRYCLRSLFVGHDRPDDLLDELRESGIPLGGKQFTVLRFATPPSPESREGAEHSGRATPMGATASASEGRIVEFVLKRSPADVRCAVLVEQHSRLSVLVSQATGDTQGDAEIMRLAEQIRRECRAVLGVPFSAGIGSTVGSAADIPESYRSATRALEYGQTFTDGSIYRDVDVDLLESSSALRGLLAEVEDVVNLVRSGKADQIATRIGALFASARSAHVSGDSIRQFSGHLLLAALRGAQMTGTSISANNSIGAAAAWNRLELCTTVEEIESLVSDTIGTLAVDVMTSHNDRHRSELVESVMEFMEENYSDTQLSLSSVADRFGVSPTYLSKIFNDGTGMKYSDFLTQLRVTVAKALLERERTSVNDVALEVGYVNPRSFIRMFHKTTGCTPGEYRRVAMLERNR